MKRQRDFNAWLRDQCERTDAIGDLSRQMRDDPKWPMMRVANLGQLSDYIRASPYYGPKATPALYSAWCLWRGDLC